MGERVIIALDFGYPKNEDALSSIDDIALVTLEVARHYKDCVVLAQENVYRRLEPFKEFPLFEIKSGQSQLTGKTGGTWGALYEAKKIMQDNNLGDIATIITHYLHVYRARLQAEKVGIITFGIHITPLPHRLYKNAAQWWCRNRFFWKLREFFGYIPLKLRGQL